jgi:hypothetical protein
MLKNNSRPIIININMVVRLQVSQVGTIRLQKNRQSSYNRYTPKGTSREPKPSPFNSFASNFISIFTGMSTIIYEKVRKYKDEHADQDM